MAQCSTHTKKELFGQILDFCKHIAGSCQITAVCLCGDCFFEPYDVRTPLQVLLVIRSFQPRLLSFVKTFDGRNGFVFAVDEWVFERDVDRGLLGEALAGRLIFPYIPLANANYLYSQESELKKRLVHELLESIILDFPELSYQIHIRPEYFVYETMLKRARVFPPIVYDLMSFMRPKRKKENVEHALRSYSEALKELEEEKLISFSNGYVTISRHFVDKTRSRKVRFSSLFKPAQKALFTSFFEVFPKIVSFLSQNKKILARLQEVAQGNSKIIDQIEDPQRYLYVPTTGGLVPLASRVDIKGFARKVLSASSDMEVNVEKIGGVLNDAFLVRAFINGEERKIIVKRFRDWSSFKWFPLTLWALGTRTFAVLGRSRLERECAINQLLYSHGLAVPKLLYVNNAERLIFMEYVEGQSLEKVIRRIVDSKDFIKVRKDLDILNKVGERFAEVHALNVALGDTKPENILVREDGEIFLMDFEQASRNGDKVWDIAEFLYYSGHYIPPFGNIQLAELAAKAFIEGYLKASGNAEIVRKAGVPKYTKVFSVFTFPSVTLAISNICKKAGN